MKKLFALLLAVVMVVGLFAACVQDPKPTEPQKPTETQPQGTDGTTEGTEPTEPAFEYPVKNPVSFEYNTWQNTFQAHHEKMNEIPMMQEWTKVTGVSPEFKITSTDEDFNLMLAGGKTTMVDVFQKSNSQLPGGPQGCIDEEIIIPLNDLIDKYMPNLKALLEKYPELDASLKLADGTYYTIPNLEAEDPLSVTTMGPFISKHMMDKYNITTMPETIDEWYTMLKTFKDKGVEAPFGSNFSTLFNAGPFIGAYLSAFPNGDGVITDGKAGKITFAYTSDEYKEYLKMLKKWYDEGLFGADFFSIASKDINANITSDKSIAGYGYIGSGIQTLTTTGQETNSDFLLVAPKYPTLEKGAISFGRCNYPVMYGGYGAYITTACEEEKYESVCRWFDYAYSEEGLLLTNYGIESESYEMKDGTPIYLDSYLNPSKEGWSTTQYQREYTMSGSGLVFMGHRDSYPQTLTMDNAKNALYLWYEQGKADKWQERTIPSLAFEAEDNETKAGITAELINYCKAEAANFVKGDKDFDKDWAAYVKACEGFDSKTLVGLYQYHYDAYFEQFS